MFHQEYNVPIHNSKRSIRMDGYIIPINDKYLPKIFAQIKADIIDLLNDFNIEIPEAVYQLTKLPFDQQIPLVKQLLILSMEILTSTPESISEEIDRELDDLDYQILAEAFQTTNSVEFRHLIDECAVIQIPYLDSIAYQINDIKGSIRKIDK